MKNLWSFVKKLLFPEICFGCGRIGSFCCDNCRKLMIPVVQVCPECHRYDTKGYFCKSCQYHNEGALEWRIDRVLVALRYKKGNLLSLLIKQYKHVFVRDLNIFLANFLIELIKLEISREELKEFLIVPVPIGPKRLKERGFNQSLELAKSIGEALNLKVWDYLVREDRLPQSSLNRKERLLNLVGAMGVKNTFSVVPQKVLLVDDIVTTGATLRECAKVLRKLGTNNITAVVLGRGAVDRF